jgi:hypothetical protein
VRCDTCGGRNSDDAAWCTQCYAPFQEAEPASDPLIPPSQPTAPSDPETGDAPQPDAPASFLQTSTDVSGGAAEAAPSSTDPSSEPAGRTDRDIREIDGRVEWRCSTCASWVALENPVCATCGAARVGFGDPATPTANVTDVAERTLLGASAVLPGAGHLLAGRVGSGITRAALFLLWAAGGLWWILSTQDGRSPGVVLLVGAVVLWGTTLIDINAVARQRVAEPFGVRGLLWTVVGVTGLLMLMVAFAAAGSLGG